MDKTDQPDPDFQQPIFTMLKLTKIVKKMNEYKREDQLIQEYSQLEKNIKWFWTTSVALFVTTALGTRWYLNYRIKLSNRSWMKLFTKLTFLPVFAGLFIGTLSADLYARKFVDDNSIKIARVLNNPVYSQLLHEHDDFFTSIPKNK